MPAVEQIRLDAVPLRAEERDPGEDAVGERPGNRPAAPEQVVIAIFELAGGMDVRARLAQDDVHRTGDRVLSEQGPLGTPQDLDPFHIWKLAHPRMRPARIDPV